MFPETITAPGAAKRKPKTDIINAKYKPFLFPLYSAQQPYCCAIHLCANSWSKKPVITAAKAKGKSSFKNLGELNKKESPRLDIAINFLKNIGVKVERKKDDIVIYGNPKLELNKNIHIKNYLKDHRVFMMSCIAALSFGGKWKIDDKDSINTSFPIFLKILKKLGAKIN